MTSLVTGVLLSVVVTASTVDDDILKRIQPVGEVCVAGEDCGDIAAPAATASTGPRTGEDIYKSTCFGCHGTGAAGAPKFGDAAAWEPYISKGIDTLISNAISGINAMPPRGTCGDCSDEEIAATVNYIVDHSK